MNVNHAEKKLNLQLILNNLNLFRLPLVLFIIAIFFILSGFSLFLRGNIKDKEILIERSATSSSDMKIAVDIAGAVENPGMYELSQGSRMQDLIKLAGGFSKTVNNEWVAKVLNRAAFLTDGSKIYIPSENETNSRTITNSNNNVQGVSTENTININNASETELDKLPGIGPVTAQKIIQARPYSTVEEVLNKKAVTKSIYEKIKDLISVY